MVANCVAIKTETIGDEAESQAPMIAAESESTKTIMRPESGASAKKPETNEKGKKGASTTDSADKLDIGTPFPATAPGFSLLGRGGIITRKLGLYGRK